MPTFSSSSVHAAMPPPPPSVKKPGNRRKKEPAPPTIASSTDPAEPAPEPAPASSPEPTSEPTFPNIVILKQTEHNYIVKHNHYPPTSSSSALNDDNKSIVIQDDLVSPNQIHKGHINKKRGRKPKAGLILNSNGGIYDTTEVPNIILHLKCRLSDLKTTESISNYEYTPAIQEVESYIAQSNYLQLNELLPQHNHNNTDHRDIDDQRDSSNENYSNNCGHQCDSYNDAYGCSDSQMNGGDVNTLYSSSLADAKSNPSSSLPSADTVIKPQTGKKATPMDSAIHVLNERNQKEIMKKIQRLKHTFHNGETVQTKANHRPACFWDTCEFDGPIFYIPIMIVNGVFQVNGCFCSPQCAVASLLKDPLDTSTKFERLHLIHLLYGGTTSKGFRPAPNPHYLLDKYYGNLTIQEYRGLLKGTQMIHIVNKPLTHILPELYEDNNDFLVNSKVIPTNSLKMKKKYKTMIVQSGAE
jgi:hypothetical protein